LVGFHPLFQSLSVIYISINDIKQDFALKFFHHLADISQASSAFRIFFSALTISKFLFTLDFFHYCRSTILSIILLNVFPGIFKTKTNQITQCHFLSN